MVEHLGGGGSVVPKIWTKVRPWYSCGLLDLYGPGCRDSRRNPSVPTRLPFIDGTRGNAEPGGQLRPRSGNLYRFGNWIVHDIKFGTISHACQAPKDYLFLLDKWNYRFQTYPQAQAIPACHLKERTREQRHRRHPAPRWAAF